MKILFHLGHPAHFHLFKHTIRQLEKMGYEIHILIKTKDVLEELILEAGFKYTNILPKGRSHGKTGAIKDFYRRGKSMREYCRKFKPDLLMGTSPDICYTGKLLGIPAINVIEDDAANILPYAFLSYPFATSILSPDCNDNLFWNYKTTFYPGYHELAYLHPDYFTPEEAIAQQYLDTEIPFFLIRLTAFKAYDDYRKRGINNEQAEKLVKFLSEKGQVFISSERKLTPYLDSFRLSIKPGDIHHLLAHTQLFISDSQTMSAEAAVLGIPNIRFSDDVDRLGYLNDLEYTYGLSTGIRPDHPDLFFEKVEDWVQSLNKINRQFQSGRVQMLEDKIDVTRFFVKIITRYLSG